MSDPDEGKKRPNANYKLSKPDDAVAPKEELVFYYNREHRLAKASKNVQDLYVEKKQSRFAFLGILVADPPRRMLFYTIILMCALIWLFSFFGFLNSPFNMEGNLVKVSASVYEDTTILVINKRLKSRNAYTGAIDVAVSAPITERDYPEEDEINVPVFYHKIFFSLEKEERYSLVVPFEASELLVVLQTEKKSLKIKVSVKPVD